MEYSENHSDGMPHSIPSGHGMYLRGIIAHSDCVVCAGVIVCVCVCVCVCVRVRVCIWVGACVDGWWLVECDSPILHVIEPTIPEKHTLRSYDQKRRERLD